MSRSREPRAGEAQTVAPDLALVKDEMDAEEYDMSQHGQEQDLSALKHEYDIDIEEHLSAPDLSAVKYEIDIEEHDVLQYNLSCNPCKVEDAASQPGSSVRPELSVVKVEAGAQELGSVQGAEPQSMSQELVVKSEFMEAEESQTAQGSSSHSVIVKGLGIKIEEDPILDESWKLFSSTVVLRDSGAELQQSGRFQLPYSSPCRLADHDSDAAMLLTEAPNKKEKIKCNLCEYTTCATRYSCLKRHMMTHRGDKVYKCDHCQFRSTRKVALSVHIKTHTGEKIFKCDMCQYSSSYKYNLKLHIRAHTREKPFKCDQCQYSSARRESLLVHKMTHTGEKIFKCDMCQYSSTYKYNLKLHIRAHTGEKPFKCDQCQYSSARRESLLVHKMTHTGEKPFKCDKCHYSGTSKYCLIVHMRAHTGEKPYKCDQCQYSSVRRGALLAHKKTHTGEKPYKCDQCQYSSAHKGSLKVHKRTHLGSFRCDQCQYTCKRKNQLRAHKIIDCGEKGLLTCESVRPAEGSDSVPVRPPATKTYSRLARKNIST